jgi:hypothetical protein
MLEQKYWHKSITAARVGKAVERDMFGLDNPGFCLICGEEADGCEPDACNYRCDSCGAEQVFGAEELLMLLYA